MPSDSKQIQAGEREAIKASEEVQVRNLKSMMEFSNDTRKVVLELREIIDSLQNRMIAMNTLIDQQRIQLANLQQQFYAKGTVSYTGDE